MTTTLTTTGYPLHTAALPGFNETAGQYTVRFAYDETDLPLIQKLRFAVFNLEMAEGLVESYATCRDEDEFDPYCHHLMVTDDAGDVVGTYRMQTVQMAATLGFYSET